MDPMVGSPDWGNKNIMTSLGGDRSKICPIVEKAKGHDHEEAVLFTPTVKKMTHYAGQLPFSIYIIQDPS